ncbi:hypothetical protein M514_23748 [Trichuris suis]|uniref:Uncharacterized protein n=1 Tax=Trichuris suis TaxID=68888 RepID=A0A085N3J2_9BILA|nr:hypothetical protein M514_23748 [Trichuris suis]
MPAAIISTPANVIKHSGHATTTACISFIQSPCTPTQASRVLTRVHHIRVILQPGEPQVEREQSGHDLQADGIR